MNVFRATAVVCLFLVMGSCGCDSPSVRPLNPVLENAQANLEVVESRLAEKRELTHGDYFELGMARRRVWSIYLGRSRYSGYKARRKAAANRRNAERVEQKMIHAFRQAMDQPTEPHWAARAKMQLAFVYGEKRDWDRQIRVLKGILRDHGDLRDPRYFGVFGTPQYYCYYTLGHAYKANIATRRHVVDTFARALLAIDQSRRHEATIAYVSAKEHYRAEVLGQLIQHDPRIVLPRYQRLLPADINEPPWSPHNPKPTGPGAVLGGILAAYRKNAPTRITLTVQHVDYNGVLVGYEVIFPGYAKRIDEWRKRLQDPRPRLGDDFSGMKPIFRLSFAALSAQESFHTAAYKEKVFAPSSATGLLVFDQNGRSTGKIILKWSDVARRSLDIYLMAELQTGYRGWGPAISPGKAYVAPVRVAIPRFVVSR